MAGLNHDFLVIDSDSFSFDNYEEYETYDRVEVHDNFLRYLGDTLAWIPSFNPCTEEKYSGLCWYGPTIISSAGVEKAESVFRSWLNLFAEGPDILALRGDYSWVEGEPPESGSYERLNFNKSEIVTKLEKLVSFCGTIKKSNGAKCLLHLGI